MFIETLLTLYLLLIAVTYQNLFKPEIYAYPWPYTFNIKKRYFSQIDSNFMSKSYFMGFFMGDTGKIFIS
jgi:hypothetical protein